MPNQICCMPTIEKFKFLKGDPGLAFYTHMNERSLMKLSFLLKLPSFWRIIKKFIPAK